MANTKSYMYINIYFNLRNFNQVIVHEIGILSTVSKENREKFAVNIQYSILQI